MERDTIIQAGLEAALKLAETRPWGELTLAEIARESGQSLDMFHGIADRAALNGCLDGMLDKAMSEGSLDPGETPRTRLFDVIMLRFEAMEQVRDGLLSFLRWRDGSLDGLAIRVRARLDTASWALACAGLDADQGPPRQLERAGLAWVYGRAEAAWRSETSSDLSRTMSVLDGELVKASRRMSWLNRMRRRPGAQYPDTGR